jgi:hypothetical protein
MSQSPKTMHERWQRIDAPRFNLACAVFAMAFLIVTLTAKTIWRGDPQDFPQYYLGGWTVRVQAWDSLYPIPREGSTINPGQQEDSILRPRIAEIAQRTGVGEKCTRYIQPPPFALLLWPLSFLPFRAALWVWMYLNLLAAWGVSLQAGKLYERCVGHSTPLIGVLIVAIDTSPTVHRCVRIENMSPIVGWLIGYATLELLRRDGPRAALAITVGTVAKYSLAALLPVYLAMHKWRTILWGLLMAATLLAVALAVMTTEPFRIFFREIAPTLGRSISLTGNQSFQGFLLRILHADVVPPAVLRAVHIAQAATLLLLLWSIFRRKRSFWNEPVHVFRGLLRAGRVAADFSPIFWDHYHAYLYPFWGWLAWEGHRSRIRLAAVLLIMAASYVPTPILTSIRLPEPLASHLLWSAAGMMMLGIARLWQPMIREQQ